MNWLFWAPLLATGFHILEEFVFPGHFLEWYVTYIPSNKKSITRRFLIAVNTGLLILCYDIGALGPSRFGLALWMGVMSLLAANGIWHLRGVLKTRSYSPGVITGTLLYLPLTAYGFIYFLSTNQTTVFTALVAFAIGASYQYWSNMFHRFRSRKQ